MNLKENHNIIIKPYDHTLSNGYVKYIYCILLLSILCFSLAYYLIKSKRRNNKIALLLLFKGFTQLFSFFFDNPKDDDIYSFINYFGYQICYFVLFTYLIEFIEFLIIKLTLLKYKKNDLLLPHLIFLIKILYILFIFFDIILGLISMNLYRMNSIFLIANSFISLLISILYFCYGLDLYFFYSNKLKIDKNKPFSELNMYSIIKNKIRVICLTISFSQFISFAISFCIGIKFFDLEENKTQLINENLEDFLIGLFGFFITSFIIGTSSNQTKSQLSIVDIKDVLENNEVKQPLI